MLKQTLFKLLGLNRVSRKLAPLLEAEGVVVLHEALSGWYITRNVKAPGRRHLHRREGFLGILVVTHKRLLCYTLWNQQINIQLDDPRINQLFAEQLSATKLSLSFDASVFRDDWQGVIEFRFNTDKAAAFVQALLAQGVQRGNANTRKR